MTISFHFRSRNHDGKKCGELSEKAVASCPGYCGGLSRVLWRDVQGIVAGCLGAGCLCGELSGPRAQGLTVDLSKNVIHQN